MPLAKETLSLQMYKLILFFKKRYQFGTLGFCPAFCPAMRNCLNTMNIHVRAGLEKFAITERALRVGSIYGNGV